MLAVSGILHLRSLHSTVPWFYLQPPSCLHLVNLVNLVVLSLIVLCFADEFSFPPKVLRQWLDGQHYYIWKIVYGELEMKKF